LTMMIPFMAIIITCTFICSLFLLMWSFYACFCLKWEGGLNRTSLVELQARPLASFASCLCVNTCMELSRVLLAIGCGCKSLGKYFFDKLLLTPVFFYIYKIFLWLRPILLRVRLQWYEGLAIGWCWKLIAVVDSFYISFCFGGWKVILKRFICFCFKLFSCFYIVLTC
jgi:hypothetical protein